MTNEFPIQRIAGYPIDFTKKIFAASMPTVRSAEFYRYFDKIKWSNWRNVVCRGAAILVGLVFLLAALSKLGNLGEFQKALDGYSYIPLWMRGMAVLLIPGVELVIGICLLASVHQQEAALIATLLLVGFVGLGAYSNATGSHGICGCIKLNLPQWFEVNGWWIVGRNLILIFLSMVSFGLNKNINTTPVV